MKSNSTTKTPSGLFRRMLQSVFGLIIFLGFQNKSVAQYVDVTINPSVSSVQVGQTFNVDVIVDFTAAGSFNVIDVFLDFNELDLEVVSAPTPGPTLNAILPGTANDFASVATMNATGEINYSRFNSGPAPTHPNADFVYFTVSFRALRVPPGGSSALGFSTTLPRETAVINGATQLTIGTPGGTVNVTAAGACSGTLASAGSCDGEFNVQLTNTTGTGPFELEINGNTYSNITPNTPFTFVPVGENLFGSADPASYSTNADGGGAELGVRFQSSQAGYVTGIRFYAPSSPVGSYYGHLWTSTGTLLATALFTTVNGNDWNEVSFSSPILISANTDYVASYYSTEAYYAGRTFAFDVAYTNGGSLVVPAGGPPTNVPHVGYSPTGNGVFNYNTVGATTPIFPTDNYYNANYFVDVNFVPLAVTLNLTSLSDDNGCTITGTPLQNLVVISPDCGTLPVRLVNLSASPQDNKITLRWTTSSEINNTGFRVQRSVEAGNSRWEDLGFVAGAGNSTTTRNYIYVDNDLAPRRYYYRLMQIDIDGNVELTPVVSATINGKAESMLEQNFPNPFRNGTTTIRFTIPRPTQVTLSVFDMNGRLVKTLVNGKKDAGTHAIPFSAGSLGSGVYYYKLQAGDFTEVKKMTIQ